MLEISVVDNIMLSTFCAQCLAKTLIIWACNSTSLALRLNIAFLFEELKTFEDRVDLLEECTCVVQNFIE